MRVTAELDYMLTVPYSDMVNIVEKYVTPVWKPVVDEPSPTVST